MEVKSILQSKTFWMAVAQAVVGAVVVFQSAYPEIGWLAILKSVVDVALRFNTEKAVVIK